MESPVKSKYYKPFFAEVEEAMNKYKDRREQSLDVNALRTRLFALVITYCQPEDTEARILQHLSSLGFDNLNMTKFMHELETLKQIIQMEKTRNTTSEVTK